jgi:putative hydrolase of the HAD superfamily
MIRAVIFDFDGLIIDTETPWFESYKEVYSQYGVELPLEIWAKCIGTSFHVFDPHVYVEEKANCIIDRDVIKKETKDLYTYFMKNQVVRPGVLDYLSEAKEMGLKIGLASSSSRYWVDSYLNQFELKDYFEIIHTSDDVSKVKPDPELYVKTINSLQVKGNEVIAFEDSLNGSMAAKGAGAYCVVVPNNVTQFMKFVNYDMRMSSMDQISLKEVITTIQDNSII